MIRRLQNEDSSNLLLLDSSEKCETSYFSQDFLQCHSTRESFLGSNSEILWSHEAGAFSENDFFKDQVEEFADLTGRTTSSCSWHNDDFDMKSSNQIRLSLDAIEDTLYEQQKSSLLTKEVFEECCNWSAKFPYIRLKGEQLLKPADDSVVLYSSNKSCVETCHSEKAPCLQVTGKKMAIHSHEKYSHRKIQDSHPDSTNEPYDLFEEIIEIDGEYEECIALDTGQASDDMEQLKAESALSFKSLEEKVIERIALEIWPKVVSLLQSCSKKPSFEVNGAFQLPPLAAAVEQMHNLSRRPRTEGTDFPIPDFPKLGSFLTVSPKVLQSKKEYGTWKGSSKSARPSSEVHSSQRNNTVVSENIRKDFQFQTPEFVFKKNVINTPKQAQLVSAIYTKEEKNQDVSNVFLPVLEEDILDPAELLKGFHLETVTNETRFRAYDSAALKRRESFLPPIDGKNHLSSNVKFTKNLFTYFGSQLPSEKSKMGETSVFRNPRTPSSRPATGASRKASKQSVISNQKLHNEEFTLNNNNIGDVKRQKDGSSEKQLTLFPIVTPLLPNQERNCSNSNKGLVNSFMSGRKR